MQYKYIWKQLPQTNIEELFVRIFVEHSHDIYIGNLCKTSGNNDAYRFHKIDSDDDYIIITDTISDAKKKAESYVERQKYKIWDEKAEEYRMDREDRD